jgi:hypothetical protein
MVVRPHVFHVEHSICSTLSTQLWFGHAFEDMDSSSHQQPRITSPPRVLPMPPVRQTMASRPSMIRAIVSRARHPSGRRLIAVLATTFAVSFLALARPRPGLAQASCSSLKGMPYSDSLRPVDGRISGLGLRRPGATPRRCPGLSSNAARGCLARESCDELHLLHEQHRANVRRRTVPRQANGGPSLDPS